MDKHDVIMDKHGQFVSIVAPPQHPNDVYKESIIQQIFGQHLPPLSSQLHWLSFQLYELDYYSGIILSPIIFCSDHCICI